MARIIELYIDPRQAHDQVSAIWQAFVNARGPQDPPYGTRTVVVQFDPRMMQETFRVTLDHYGFRLVFEDELPAHMSISQTIVVKTVITDRVRDSARPLKECAGSRNDSTCRSAWRVTARDSHYWEIVVHSSDPGQAIRLFEEVRAGGHAGGSWVMSPWRAVNL